MNAERGVWGAVEEAIGAQLGRGFRIESRKRAIGGCIDQAFRIRGGGETLFVKLARAERLTQLQAEAAGLDELRAAAGLRVPVPVTSGRAGTRAFLVVEYVALRPLDGDAMVALGEGLAELHGVIAPRFGWERDNAIGATPQRNARSASWTEFWRENRLGYQLELAAARGNQALARAGERLLAKLGALLAGHAPEPSLLHGDLWGGNAAMDERGAPVLFDPAVYYGDRETDLAMTELFGGFSPLFYEAYHGAWPPDDGYREVRRDLYQLYHLLNHDALFGGHYGGEALRRIERLLAAV